MYLVIVVALMLVLPVGSLLTELLAGPGDASVMALVGKWFVFWSVGVRLWLAGLRQFLQPAFTAQEMFDIRGEDALPLVRELGVANFATGVVGIASIAASSFVLPSAIIAGIFYGVAGVRHAAQRARSRNENIAMVSDLFVFVVLAVYVASTRLG